MNQETAPAAESGATPPRRKRLVTMLRLLALALPLAVLVTGAVALPGWIPLLPRAVRRGMIEAILRTLLIGYSALVVMAMLGTPLLVCLAARTRRTGRIRPGILR